MTLELFELFTLIVLAIEGELIEFGIERNVNNVRGDAVPLSPKTNILSTGDDVVNSVNICRATHFLVNNGNIDHKRSREHNYPDPAALAKQTKTGLDQVNCHMATEMGLPRNGNIDDRNTVNENLWTPRHKIPELLTGKKNKE